MKDYRVTWEVDIFDAGSPREAAEQAAEIQRQQVLQDDAFPGVFDVADEDGEITRVNLAESEEDDTIIDRALSAKEARIIHLMPFVPLQSGVTLCGMKEREHAWGGDNQHVFVHSHQWKDVNCPRCLKQMIAYPKDDELAGQPPARETKTHAD